MKSARYAAIATILTLSAAPALQPALAASNDASDQSTVAVTLVSASHATGSATLTKMQGGVAVKVMTKSSPAGNEIAEIRKGTCASRGIGMQSQAGATGTNEASGASGDTSGSGSGAMASSTNSTMQAGATPGTNINSGVKTTGNMSAQNYPIGKLATAQGDQGEAVGEAQATLHNVSLSNLVSGGYSIAVFDSSAGSSMSGALCADLNNALAPTTPASSQ